MARFVYRLQKVFELRERKKKEQEQRVVEAQKVVRKVQQAIEDKFIERRNVREHMLSSPNPMMMDFNDKYLHHLNQQIDVLREELRQAEAALQHERSLLIKAQAELEALIKHKEKMKEEWMEEEKRLEMKQLDEVAGQRYFRAQQAALQESLESDETNYNDEY